MLLLLYSSALLCIAASSLCHPRPAHCLTSCLLPALLHPACLPAACPQTYEGLCQAFRPDQMQGVQEEVQLREQDFGNFQDTEGKKREKAERLRFGRFFYRFPNGESGADVYDR